MSIENALADAKDIFQAENYGLSQNLFHQIYTDDHALDFQKEEALFHIAICSKMLFNEDSKTCYTCPSSVRQTINKIKDGFRDIREA